MNEQDKDTPGRPAPGGGPVESLGSAPKPQQSFGSAPDGDEQFGDAPKPDETFGDAPTPAPKPVPSSSRGRNVPLLIGGGIVILVILAAIIGFVAR